MIGADIRQSRRHQGQHTQADKRHQHTGGWAAFAVQGVVDGRKQGGNAESTQHAKHDRQHHDDPKRLEQAEDFTDGSAGIRGHGGFRFKCR
ncbi:hypothetical protein D3C71_2084160 [compost metagenome]